ncbi:MAG: hypothetical protein KC506_03590 [Nanoarchaeota archaeon]|nr:hypothetical protein [Nanoarchaeota archaeon]
MEGQEILQQAMLLRQESEEIERQLQFVNEQITDLEGFGNNLEALEKSDEKEVLSNIGRGVFMKTTRSAGEKLFVEVGAGVIVRKTPEETRKVIAEQVKKFKDAKIQLTMQLESHADQFRAMLKEVEGLKTGEPEKE